MFKFIKNCDSREITEALAPDESNLIFLWDAEAPHPPVCLAAVVVPSGIA